MNLSFSFLPCCHFGSLRSCFDILRSISSPFIDILRFLSIILQNNQENILKPLRRKLLLSRSHPLVLSRSHPLALLSISSTRRSCPNSLHPFFCQDRSTSLLFSPWSSGEPHARSSSEFWLLPWSGSLVTRTDHFHYFVESLAMADAFYRSLYYED